jgi:hypothetical protein
MYDLVVPVEVVRIVSSKSIHIIWGAGDNKSKAEWSFDSLGDSITNVTIRNYEFKGSDLEQNTKAMDSIGGFTLVLAGLKAYLEFGIELSLIKDKFPVELRK